MRRGWIAGKRLTQSKKRVLDHESSRALEIDHKEYNSIDTILAHAGCKTDSATGAVSPPIHLASTFERDGDLSYPRGYVYSRTGNPTRNLFEQTIAELEDGFQSCAFASGCAAAHAVFQALPGGTVIIPEEMYHGNRTMLDEIFKPWGLKIVVVNMLNLTEVEKAIAAEAEQENLLVWMETPSNPCLNITDISSVCQIASKFKAITLVDATWLSPYLCRPLTLGADLVLHSTTKYIGGHSDLIGGVLTCKFSSLRFFNKIRRIQCIGGAVPSPFDCWLALRGIRSLGPRLQRQCRSAMQIALFLNKHQQIEQVFFPGLPGHLGHEIHCAQLCRKQEFGGMLSFTVVGGESAAIKLLSKLNLFKRATSLGGTESLVEHRKSIEGPHSKTPANLVRMSVGLESVEDLIRDLESAFENIQ